MNLAQLACPLCGGAFQVELAWQGHQVTCPHCEQVVTVPSLGTLTPPEFVTPGPPPEPTSRGPDSSDPPDLAPPEPDLAPPERVTPSLPPEPANRTVDEQPAHVDKQPAQPSPRASADQQQPEDEPKSSPPEATAAVENYVLSRRAPAANPGKSPFAIHETPKQVIDRQGHSVELKSRTPDQKARFRRRLHATAAIAGAAVLAILLGTLLLL